MLVTDRVQDFGKKKKRILGRSFSDFGGPYINIYTRSGHGWSGWSPSISGDHRPLQLEMVSINPPSNPWGQKSPPPPTVEGKNHPETRIRPVSWKRPPLQPLKAKSALTPKSGPQKSRNRPPLQPLKAKITLTPKSGPQESEHRVPKRGKIGPKSSCFFRWNSWCF